jgi:hypothetical protein
MSSCWAQQRSSRDAARVGQVRALNALNPLGASLGMILLVLMALHDVATCRVESRAIIFSSL